MLATPCLCNEARMIGRALILEKHSCDFSAVSIKEEGIDWWSSATNQLPESR